MDRFQDLNAMVRSGRSWSGNERNCSFLNLGEASPGGQAFANISALSGLDFADDARSVAVLDWDHDGDLDLWLGNRSAPRLRLMRNEAGRDAGQFLALRLQGNGTTTNRDAIGARVELILQGNRDRKSIKTVRAGEGFLSQSSKWLHFGLGADEVAIEKVVVHWPRRGPGATETYVGLEPNRRYLLVEGSGPQLWAAGPRRDAAPLEPKPLELPAREENLRVSAITLYQAPDIVHERFDGSAARFNTDGQWTWLNLWATWCAPCLAELEEISSHATELKAHNIEVVALAVDALGGPAAEDFQPAKAESLLKKLGFPFTGGLASRDLVASYQQLADHLIGMKVELPVPTSFLINPKNQVVAMYQGAVSTGTVLEDAAMEERPLTERWARALDLGGTGLPHERVRKMTVDYEATALFHQGFAAQMRTPHLALRAYRDALRYKPDFQEARLGMGEVFLALNQLDAAEAELRRVLAADDDQGFNHGEAHYALSLCALREGRLDDAMRSLEDAVQKIPDHESALNNLAYLLATHPDPQRRDPGRAVTLAERSVEASERKNPNHLQTLAVAYLAAGRTKEAHQTIEEGVAVARAQGNQTIEAKLLQLRNRS